MFYLLLRKLHVVVQAAQTIAVTVFNRTESIYPGALFSLCSQEFLSTLISINRCNLCTWKKCTLEERIFYVTSWEIGVCKIRLQVRLLQVCYVFSWSGLAGSHAPINTLSCSRLVLRWRSDQLLKSRSTQGVWSLSYPYVHVQLIYYIKVRWFTGA